MSEFSPTPWHISDGVIVAKDLHWIAQMELTGGEDIHGELLQNANAALIVEAVNNYETLRAELDEAKRLYSETERSNMSLGEAICTIDKENQLLRAELDAMKAQRDEAGKLLSRCWETADMSGTLIYDIRQFRETTP